MCESYWPNWALRRSSCHKPQPIEINGFAGRCSVKKCRNASFKDTHPPGAEEGVAMLAFWMRGSGSGLFHKFGFQLHIAYAVNPAVNIMVATNKFDVSHLGAHLDDLRRTFDF